MKFTNKFLTFSLVTAVIFYLANLLFGKYLVFGNANAAYWQALIVSSLIVGLVSSVVSGYSSKHKLSPGVWLFLYWALVTATIYGIARSNLSGRVGIGIAAFWVALILGAVVHLAHHHTHKIPFIK